MTITGKVEPVYRFLRELFPAECHGLLWLVGGSVRDALLGRESSDIDLLAAIPSEHLAALGFREVIGKTTAPIRFRHFPGVGNVEISLIKSDAELHADLRRRDFTINALALTLSGILVDPLQGEGDLHSRQLRVCSPHSFSDDPLRLLRAFRFEADGFALTEESKALIAGRDWNDALGRIPAERVGRELLKALAAAKPQRFFIRMAEFHIGTKWLAPLFRMASIPAGPVAYHPEGDLLSHSLQVMDRVAAVTESPLARFCALFHDLGKLATDPQYHPKHHGHEEAGFRAAAQFCRDLALPLEYGTALAWISRLHGNANRLEQLRPATRIRMAEQALRAGIVEILPLVSAADKGGAFCSDEWHRLVAVAGMTCADLGIDQEQLLAIKPAKRGEFMLQRRVEQLKKGSALEVISC
jgi:tRNA nucleotidyltransferase (CCA-adding enzyme)